MYRTIYIIYYLLYTIIDCTIHYTTYIMYCVSCCNTIILIYYIKRTDVRYTIYYLGIHYLTMYPTSCIVHYKSFVFLHYTIYSKIMYSKIMYSVVCNIRI